MGLLSCEWQHTSKQVFIFRAYQQNVRNSEWSLELLVRPFKENAFRAYLHASPPTVHLVEVMGWIRQPELETLGEAFILERSGDLRSSNHTPWDSQGHSLFNSLTTHLAVWVYIACVLLACSALLTCLM